MESLTKENFWNDLYAKYPEQVQVFCDWIDEYKKRVKWEKLFTSYQDSDTKHEVCPIKYHDLPIAMQVGIFMQFIQEQKTSKLRWVSNAPNMEAFAVRIAYWFQDAHGIAKIQNKVR